jgi:hypothetical protein
MPTFSTLIQTPEVRAIVQEGYLERAFHDALFPLMLYRGDVASVPWPGQVGDTQIFTGKSLALGTAEALGPQADPGDIEEAWEQWEATIKKYPKDGSLPVDMSTSYVAAVSLLMSKIDTLGKQAGVSMNMLARTPLLNAAMSGWTVTDGAQAAVTVLRVKRLNGFTRARRPDLVGGSPVSYDYVSSQNPLRVTIAGTIARDVIGFTPDNPGDEIGPGTILLSVAVTVADRDSVKSMDASWIMRQGIGNSGKIDLVQPANKPTCADIRSITSRLESVQVPQFEDGYYHAHGAPTPLADLFGDPEMQRMMQGAAVVGDGYLFSKMIYNVALGCVFFRNTETPYPDKIRDANKNNQVNQGTFSLADPFGGEVWDNGGPTGNGVYHTLFLGAGMLKEYYIPNSEFISDAGVTGLYGEFENLENNGVQINTNGVAMILRAPLNKHMDQVTATWKYIGGFVARPDGASAGTGRYKRAVMLQSGGGPV